MKALTVLVDVDGCIFKHLEKGPAIQWREFPILLPDVRRCFDKWEQEGTYIILMTARKECTRDELEFALRSCGLFWDQLIMSVTSGHRILINDRKSDEISSASAVNLRRNTGLGVML